MVQPAENPFKTQIFIHECYENHSKNAKFQFEHANNSSENPKTQFDTAKTLKMLKLKKPRKYLRKFSWIDAQKSPVLRPCVTEGI